MTVFFIKSDYQIMWDKPRARVALGQNWQSDEEKLSQGSLDREKKKDSRIEARRQRPYYLGSITFSP
jgi:hypothetical protein